MAEKLRTTIHYYSFDISEEDQKAEYEKLCAKLKEMGIKKFDSFSPDHSRWYRECIRPLDGQEIELETKHLFSNQWNTAPLGSISENGLRVFDWAEAIYYGYGGKRTNGREGQWLEQTPEMDEIRRNTYVCGWCGNQEPAAKGHIFCPACLGGEYLKEKDLFLTRLMSVSLHLPDRPELTEGERQHLLPLYVEAQITAGHSRHNRNAEKKRKRIGEEYRKTIQRAKVKHDGFMWLLVKDVNIDNCIYYSHKDIFSFGWRKPVDESVKSALLDLLVEFPFEYEIKSE